MTSEDFQGALEHQEYQEYQEYQEDQRTKNQRKAAKSDKSANSALLPTSLMSFFYFQNKDVNNFFLRKSVGFTKLATLNFIGFNCFALATHSLS